MNVPPSMPPYFQWIVDKRLAICAHPYHASHIRYLLEQRIQTVISIGDTYASAMPNHTRGELRVHNLYIPDGGAPTLQQCQQFVQSMDIARQRGEVGRTRSLLSSSSFMNGTCLVGCRR